MKKPPARMRNGGCWSLVTAGALGLVSQAAGQSSPYSPASPRPQTARSVAARSSVTASAAQEHFLEARIELAWLADPATFPYHLEARLAGNAVEVRGYVPSEPIRQQALRVARDESHLQVLDHVNIYASLALPAVSKSPQVLSRQALAAIKRALPAQASHLTVSVWTNGQVLIKGTVPTLAAKLTASRCLRQVSGCTCVTNQLSVVKAQPMAAVATMPALTRSVAATQGGTYLPRPNVLQSGATTSAGSQAAAMPTIGQIILDEPAAVVPAVGRIVLDAPTPAFTSVPPASRPPAMPRAAAMAEDSGPVPAVPAPGAPIRLDAAPPRRLPDLQAAAMPPASLAAEAPPRKPGSPAAPVRTYGGTFTVNSPVIGPSSAWQEVKSPYTFHPTNWRRTETGGGVRQTTSAMASTPVTTGSEEIRLASAVSESAAGAAAPASGLIILEVPQPVVLPRQQPDAAGQRLDDLRQRIARACGRMVAEVEVTCPAPRALRVGIRARNDREAERLSNAIFQLPELDPYEVSLDIPVMR